MIHPAIGISHLSNVKLANKNRIMISSIKNVLLVLMLIHSGMAQNAQYVQFKAPSGMENIVTIVQTEHIGISHLKNVLHVQSAKYSTQSRICVSAQFRRPLC